MSSVDTYLRFAEATNRLDLWVTGGRGLPEVLTEETEHVVTNVASSVAEHKVNSALDTVGDTLGDTAQKVARTATKKAAGALGRVAAKAADVVEDAEQE